MKDESQVKTMTIAGIVIDVDYMSFGDSAYIRLTFKGEDGKTYEIYDKEFMAYFYLVPRGAASVEELLAIRIEDNGKVMKPEKVESTIKKIFGRETRAFKIYAKNPMQVPKLSAAMVRIGTVYENDIVFARRYIIDKSITPFSYYYVEVEEEGEYWILKGIRSMEEVSGKSGWASLNSLCFDIETYNPQGTSRPQKDPILMISYSYSKGDTQLGKGVITYKKVDADFVEVANDEKDMLERFSRKLDELDIDVISGYASTNFDIKYMLERAEALKVELNIGRFKGETRLEKHGLIDRVKIAGRIHIDMFNVAKFISVVGAAERILKLNSFKLKDVYEAISDGKKVMVEKENIYQMWDQGGDSLKELVYYNLNDAEALRKVYNTFTPIIFELSKVTGDLPSDVAVSTTSQLVEFLLMKNAYKFNEMIPNKPGEHQIFERNSNPIEGAYVKTPDPGVYDNLVMFDFRGLYPSIIISHNIDPSAICTTCSSYYQSPTGTKFDKEGTYMLPTILKMLMDQRAEVKKMYKKDPGNIIFGSRSQALKILANAFYGYLGYARARWYSRECAASVTALGRQYIKDTIDKVEREGFKVLYGDTDSVLLLIGSKSRDEVLEILKRLNESLPKSMELELEDFYKRGVFVGKKTDKDSAVGAKKKYALISESGRIKIRGFELVRRDWSKIAQDTQRKVLEVILNEGSAEKAAKIVKEVIQNLRDGKVPLESLIIRTQLRKSIYSYDQKSPEISAARRAVESGFKKKEELEHSVIGYIITKSGNTISDKSQIYGMAKDYDADYYIEHQVLPATMRILKELNFDPEELKNVGKQKKL
ncbi:MAG: DNA-directed DNA polymerase [Candidatus Micrarchaeia archaeon]